MHKVLHLTDHHFPFHDPEGCRISIEAARRLQPDDIVIGGDLIDCYPLNRFHVDASRLNSLQEELDLAADYLRKLREAAPNANIHYCLGNHEFRVEKYLGGKAPALATLRGLRIDKLLPCAELNINVYEQGGGPTFGGILFTHGSFIRKDAGRSALALAMAEGMSVAQGHSHRMGCITVRQGKRYTYCYESACLHAKNPEYMEHTPDWHMGFSLFVFYGKDRKTHSWIPVRLEQQKPLSVLEPYCHGS